MATKRITVKNFRDENLPCTQKNFDDDFSRGKHDMVKCLLKNDIGKNGNQKNYGEEFQRGKSALAPKIISVMTF